MENFRIDRDDVQKIRELASGSFGIVYSGEYLGTSVAIKQLHSFIMSRYNLNSFENEVLHLSTLRHPNVLLLIGYCESSEDQPPMMITELCDMTLEQYINEEFPFSEERIVEIGKQICLGLTYIHKKDLIHRDIKPANIFVNGGQRLNIKIGDFGLAKADLYRTMTLQPSTLLYLAPEIKMAIVMGHRNLNFNNTIDIFAFGIVLFEIVTGILNEERSYELMELLPNLPDHNLLDERWIDIIQQCCNQNPNVRPSSITIIELFSQISNNKTDQVNIERERLERVERERVERVERERVEREIEAREREIDTRERVERERAERDIREVEAREREIKETSQRKCRNCASVFTNNKQNNCRFHNGEKRYTGTRYWGRETDKQEWRRETDI